VYLFSIFLLGGTGELSKQLFAQNWKYGEGTHKSQCTIPIFVFLEFLYIYLP
jgi:hypothetical protein